MTTLPVALREIRGLLRGTSRVDRARGAASITMAGRPTPAFGADASAGRPASARRRRQPGDEERPRAGHEPARKPGENTPQAIVSDHRCRAPSRQASPSCPSRACASRPRSPPRRSSAASSRPRASSAARCGCRASARARCPPPVVIRRLGRDAVLDEAVRSVARHMVHRGDRRAPGSRRSASPSSTSGSCRPRAQPLAFSIEIGVRPARQARRATRASRSAGASPGRRRRADRRGDRAAARPVRDARHGRAPSRERRPRRDRLRRLDRRRGVRGRRGARPAARARLGPADPRLRGAARRAPAPARSGRSTSRSRTTIRLGARRQGGDVRGHGQRGQGQEPARARRRLRGRGRRIRHARGAPRGHRGERLEKVDAAAIEREFEEAVLEAAVAEADGRGARQARSRARARVARGACSTMLARQGISKEAYLRIAGRDEEALAHEAEPEAAQALGARRCWRRSSRPRRSSRATRSSSRRSSRPPNAAGHDRREAARAAAPGRPRSTGCAREVADPSGDRSAGARGQADQRRAGQGAPEALDARQGGR